jgi:hypothetical protein
VVDVLSATTATPASVIIITLFMRLARTGKGRPPDARYQQMMLAAHIILASCTRPQWRLPYAHLQTASLTQGIVAAAGKSAAAAPQVRRSASPHTQLAQLAALLAILVATPQARCAPPAGRAAGRFAWAASAMM